MDSYFLAIETWHMMKKTSMTPKSKDMVRG